MAFLRIEDGWADGLQSLTRGCDTAHPGRLARLWTGDPTPNAAPP
ncbi:hypothetical protein DVS28_a0609 [Euzebya pacifica]|uniref:Uncharacterized protein n=1 Tax=Euzebya pacifica TaxID=1608957 RepID=A0A346XSW4_9ACTN|nr:hypothetical protein DVS28_a0609 [Euzebya pacifica]